MLERIEAINKAYVDKNYIAALSLALTIPDICAQAEYDNKLGVGERYRKWFNEHIQEYYGESGIMTLSNPSDKMKYLDNHFRYKFDAEACYKLRCAVLHSGNDDIKIHKNDYNFIIYATNPDPEKRLPCEITSVFVNNSKGVNQTILLDLDMFCYYMCKEAKESYEKNKEAFEPYQLPITFVPLETVEDLREMIDIIGFEKFKQ